MIYERRDDPYPHESSKPESPGKFCFPPVAALTTSGARLMLALLEHVVEDMGGTFAFCDTDSMALVATREGGFVPCPGGPHTLPDGREAVDALSWPQVEEIVRRFERLNPYDPGAVKGSVLEVEEENFTEEGKQRELRALVISAKRYVLFTEKEGKEGGVKVVKASEHGLGHLLNPLDPEEDSSDWIHELWRLALREHRGEDVGLPDWMDRPAISRVTVSSPHLHRPFADYNAGKPYAEQVKPMNFLLSAHLQAFGHPARANPQQFHLFAAFESDPNRWLERPWIDRYTGESWPVTTRETANGQIAGVKAYRHVYRDYLAHPEPTCLGPEGVVCGPQTRWLFCRRPVEPLELCVIGKESNQLEQVEKGLISDLDEVLAVYARSMDTDLDRTVELLSKVPTEELAERAGVSARTVYRVRAGNDQPQTDTWRRLRVAVQQVLSSHER